MIVGPWSVEQHHRCIFGSTAVDAIVVQQGVLSCATPPHADGIVPLVVQTVGVGLSASVQFVFKRHRELLPLPASAGAGARARCGAEAGAGARLFEQHALEKRKSRSTSSDSSMTHRSTSNDSSMTHLSTSNNSSMTHRSTSSAGSSSSGSLGGSCSLNDSAHRVSTGTFKSLHDITWQDFLDIPSRNRFAALSLEDHIARERKVRAFNLM